MFRIGDYAVDEFGNVFHVTTTNEKLIINSSSINFRHATEQEIEKYHF